MPASCSEPLLWVCQACSLPLETTEWEKHRRSCPVCHQTAGSWRCGKCSAPFDSPLLSDFHPCKAEVPPFRPGVAAREEVPASNLPSFRFLFFGATILGIILLGGPLLWKVFQGEKEVAPKVTEQKAIAPIPVAPTIQVFVDRYRAALLSQAPEGILSFFSAFGRSSMVYFYGTRMSVEDLAKSLITSAGTDPVTVHRVDVGEIDSIISPRDRCQAYIVSLVLDLETKSQRRQKGVRLYVLERTSGNFSILAENNIMSMEPTESAREFAGQITRALVRQEPDSLILLYPGFDSKKPVRYYEKERLTAWIYADLVESKIHDPLKVKRAAIRSLSDLITSPQGDDYYNLRIDLTFQPLSSPLERKKVLAVLFEQRSGGGFQVFLEENYTP